MSLVPTAASKKMMLSQIASKQAENGERAGSPDVLRCSSQVQHLSPLWLVLGGRVAPALCLEVPNCGSSGFALILLLRELGNWDPAGKKRVRVSRELRKVLVVP